MSWALVKALSLTTEKHPRPYKVGWIRRGVGSTITEVCKVPLSIGKSYQDENTCDVLEMDACHIILGRPWQFDRSVTHRGRENTYSFKWNDRKIALLPLVPEYSTPLTPVQKGNTLLTVNATQFSQAAKESQLLLAVVMKEHYSNGEGSLRGSIS